MQFNLAGHLLETPEIERDGAPGLPQWFISSASGDHAMLISRPLPSLRAVHSTVLDRVLAVSGVRLWKSCCGMRRVEWADSSQGPSVLNLPASHTGDNLRHSLLDRHLQWLPRIKLTTRHPGSGHSPVCPQAKPSQASPVPWFQRLHVPRLHPSSRPARGSTLS